MVLSYELVRSETAEPRGWGLGETQGIDNIGG